MSTDESSHLEFQGMDLKECEQFIAAVNKHARAQGKLRDDQWIADFVAICLTGDALTWWSLLDEETQGSWKLLRQAMISTFRPLFYGKSGTEAEDFVRQVRKRALHVGKLNDQRWGAEFASGCFVGSALRWYISLDLGVRGDWNSLQQAIFAQYGQGFEEGSPIVPMPAPAATSPVTAATAPVANNGRCTGRIKVLGNGDSEIYYLSKVLGLVSDQPGRLHATASVADALVVEYESFRASDGHQDLLIPNNQIPGCDALGMKWYYADRTEDRNWIGICGADSKSGARSPGSEYHGPILPRAWKISQSDHQISISAFDTSGSGERLSFFVINGLGHRWVFFKLKKSPGDLESKLLFEPI